MRAMPRARQPTHMVVERSYAGDRRADSEGVRAPPDMVGRGSCVSSGESLRKDSAVSVDAAVSIPPTQNGVSRFPVVTYGETGSNLTAHSAIAIGNFQIPDFSFLSRGLAPGTFVPITAGGHSEVCGDDREEMSRGRLISERSTPPSESSETPVRKVPALAYLPVSGGPGLSNGGTHTEVGANMFFAEGGGEGTGYASMPPPMYTRAMSSMVDPQEYPPGIPAGGTSRGMPWNSGCERWSRVWLRARRRHSTTCYPNTHCKPSKK